MTEVWTPTHRVPAAGSACWQSPDTSGPPLAVRLDPGLEVRLVEREGGWGHVECSNGWWTWVDGRSLEQLPPAVPAPPRTAPGRALFTPTHVIPVGGLAAFSAHDASVAALATLDPGVSVQVVDRWGDWARIACCNGWTAWVDGRRLRPAVPSPGQSVRTGMRLLTRPRAVPPGAGPLALVGPLALAGAALVIAGSLLPWLSAGGLSVSAWDIPLRSLIGEASDSQFPSVGLLLLVTAVVVLPVLRHRPFPTLVLLVIAAVPIDTATQIIQLKVREAPDAGLGAGVVMVVVGGVLIAAEGLRPWWAARPRRSP